MEEPFFGKNIKEAIELFKSIKRARRQMQNTTKHLTHEEVFMEKCKECAKVDCTHENVKYHSCCLKVRCNDCGMEWTDQRWTQLYIPYVPYVEPIQPWIQPYIPYNDTGYANVLGNQTFTIQQ